MFDPEIALSTAQDMVVDLGAGVTFEWRLARRMVIFTPERATREAVDILYITMKAVTEIWHTSPVVTGAVFDISNKDFGPTPYLMHHLHLLGDEPPPTVQSHLVLVLSRTLFGQIFTMTLRTVPLPANRLIKPFMKRDVALAWLNQTFVEADSALATSSPIPDEHIDLAPAKADQV